MILKQFWTIKCSKTLKYFDDLKQFTAFKVANMLESGGGGLNQPTSSRSPQNTVKNQNFFDFPKVHNELKKIHEFWDLQNPFFMEKWMFENSAG